uniref:Uncharacterized protein n=1 Tax=Quercus lobata TaxID=97700 RepID=A0A7N2MEB2_QUELO
MAEATKKYAVVTGASKGIGFGICRKLASNTIMVVVTARDKKKAKGHWKLKVDILVKLPRKDVQITKERKLLGTFNAIPFSISDFLTRIPWNHPNIQGEIPNEWAKGVLIDAESLIEERLDEELILNAYTRILAKKYPSFCINCVCPGYVKTDINYNYGILAVEEGTERILRLALVPSGGPSGLFFSNNEVTPF